MAAKKKPLALQTLDAIKKRAAKLGVSHVEIYTDTNRMRNCCGILEIGDFDDYYLKQDGYYTGTDEPYTSAEVEAALALQVREDMQDHHVNLTVATTADYQKKTIAALRAVGFKAVAKNKRTPGSTTLTIWVLKI